MYRCIWRLHKIPLEQGSGDPYNENIQTTVLHGICSFVISIVQEFYTYFNSIREATEFTSGGDFKGPRIFLTFGVFSFFCIFGTFHFLVLGKPHYLWVGAGNNRGRTKSADAKRGEATNFGQLPKGGGFWTSLEGRGAKIFRLDQFIQCS